MVTGSKVLARELAARDPRFAGLPPEHDLGYAPDPGKWREVPVPAAPEEAARNEPARDEPVNGSFGGSSPQTVCVMRRVQALSRESVLEALDLGALGAGTGAEVRVELLAWSEALFPAGKIEMPLSGVVPPSRGSAEVLWRGALRYEPGRSMAVWARLRLTRDTECLRLRGSVRRGEVLEPTRTESVPCDAPAIVAGALSSVPIAGASAVLARDLPAGSWLLREHFTVLPTLRRGDRARLVVRSGAVALAVPVDVEQAGSLGEQVWVRRVRDRRRLRAEVTGPGELLIDAGDKLP